MSGKRASDFLFKMPFYYKIEDPKKEFLGSDLESIVHKGSQGGGPYRSSTSTKINLLYLNKLVLEEVKELKFLLYGLELVSDSEISVDFLQSIGKVIEAREVTNCLYKLELTLRKVDNLANTLDILENSADSIRLSYDPIGVRGMYPSYPKIGVNVDGKKSKVATYGPVQKVLMFHRELQKVAERQTLFKLTHYSITFG